jgi:Domain of unknown function (DUF1917)
MTDSKPQPPNLDLIGMVQQARMLHDSEAIPSQVAAVYWIESKPRDAKHAPTSAAGYWLIETDVANVDAVWAQVKAATERGELGYKSKVSTASRSGNANERVIYACTVDAGDAADIKRVAEALATLGIAPTRYVEDPAE